MRRRQRRGLFAGHRSQLRDDAVAVAVQQLKLVLARGQLYGHDIRLGLFLGQKQVGQALAVEHHTLLVAPPGGGILHMQTVPAVALNCKLHGWIPLFSAWVCALYCTEKPLFCQ